MADNDTFSLFNQSSQPKKKSVIKVKKKVHAPGASSPQSPSSAAATPHHRLVLDPEIQAMMDKMRDMHMDIESKLRKIYELTGMNREQIQNYVDNPKNFTTEEWNNLQKNRDTIQGQLLAFLGSKVRADRDRLVTQELQRKKAGELTKNRKSKMIAARKKNWISMR